MIKRVYSRTDVRCEKEGYLVLLDDKAVRSPGRRELLLPTEPFAHAIASEWDAQGEEIDMTALRLTKPAGRAADMTEGERVATETAVVAYVETDLVSYRAEEPPDLMARQAAAWNPLLRWAMRNFSAAPGITIGVVPARCDEAVVARYAEIVAGLDKHTLVGLQTLTAITGSLIIALAVLLQELDAGQAWQVGQIDENHRTSRWGDDPLEAESRAARRADLNAAARFLELLRPIQERQ